MGEYQDGAEGRGGGDKGGTMRCESCKFWLAKVKDWGIQAQNCTCSKLYYKLGGAPAADELVYWDGEGYCAFLVTGPEFGCVHFERRGDD